MCQRGRAFLPIIIVIKTCNYKLNYWDMTNPRKNSGTFLLGDCSLQMQMEQYLVEKPEGGKCRERRQTAFKRRKAAAEERIILKGPG